MTGDNPNEELLGFMGGYGDFGEQKEGFKETVFRFDFYNGISFAHFLVR